MSAARAKVRRARCFLRDRKGKAAASSAQDREKWLPWRRRKRSEGLRISFTVMAIHSKEAALIPALLVGFGHLPCDARHAINEILTGICWPSQLSTFTACCPFFLVAGAHPPQMLARAGTLVTLPRGLGEMFPHTRRCASMERCCA